MYVFLIQYMYYTNRLINVTFLLWQISSFRPFTNGQKQEDISTGCISICGFVSYSLLFLMVTKKIMTPHVVAGRYKLRV